MLRRESKVYFQYLFVWHYLLVKAKISQIFIIIFGLHQKYWICFFHFPTYL